LRQQPPRRRIGGDRPEQSGLIPQHREIGDRFAAIGQCHRQIDGDPARVVAALPLPQPGEGLAECAGQPGRVGEIGEQPCTGVTDHASPVAGHHDLRTCCGSLHPASAFRNGMIRTFDKPYLP